MSASTVQLDLLAGEFAVCRFPADAESPPVPGSTSLYSVTRTAAELSVVCAAADAPTGGEVEAGWRAFGVRGPLAFELTGILAGLAQPLAAAGVSIFALSTYDTDYLLVRNNQLHAAVDALTGNGHTVHQQG